MMRGKHNAPPTGFVLHRNMWDLVLMWYYWPGNCSRWNRQISGLHPVPQKLLWPWMKHCNSPLGWGEMVVSLAASCISLTPPPVFEKWNSKQRLKGRDSLAYTEHNYRLPNSCNSFYIEIIVLSLPHALWVGLPLKTTQEHQLVHDVAVHIWTSVRCCAVMMWYQLLYCTLRAQF